MNSQSQELIRKSYNKTFFYEEKTITNERKGKRKAQYCDLEGQDDVVYDYEKYGTSIVSEQVNIPSSSQNLNLVGKALCRKYYNKLIVNAKKPKPNLYSHPKHNLYISTARD
ncbi:12798_t:CDS:2, partial [Funneliformis geosporum]